MAVIRYVQEQYPDRLKELFKDLGPEMHEVADPLSFLSDPNNWISSSLLIQLYQNAKRLLRDDDAAYKIGYHSVIRNRLGYIQKILLYAFGNPARTIKHIQKINDHFNRTKTIQILECGRYGAKIRLIWDKNVPLSRDFCLMNKGVYSAIPTIWGLPSARVDESKCFFNGDDYCDYHFSWLRKKPVKDFLRSLFTPWEIAKASIAELERDKELIREKYDQVHKLNISLQRKVDQLQSLQESSSTALSTLNLDELLDIILNRLLKVAHLDRAGIFLVDNETRSLTLIHAVGADQRTLEKLKNYQVPLSKKKNIIAKAARLKRPIIVNDVGRMNLNPNNPLLKGFQPKAFILVPLTVRGEVVGMLVGDNHHDAGLIGQVDREFLESFGNQIAMAIDNAGLYKQLQASERKYREMVENAHEGVWILNEEAKFSFANPRLLEMLGQPNLFDRSIFSLVDEKGKKTLLRLLIQNMNGKVARKEVAFQGREGVVHALVSSVPIMTEGRYSGSFAMATDLTEKRWMEEKMLQTQKMEAVGTMAGGIAHDFNNILTGILGYSSILKQKLRNNSDLKRHVEVIEQSSQKAAKLVQQLLTFSRGSEFKDFVSAEVNTIVQETLRLLTSSLGKDINLKVSLEDGLPAIDCDPTQIQQILLNICLNARDAMPEGGTLTIKTKLHASVDLSNVILDFSPGQGRYICISISDTGSGIKPEHKARIFDPFYTTKEVGKGTGLGLAMVYGIVKNSGGFIRVDSKVGKGTTFDLYFPEGKEAGTDTDAAQDVSPEVRSLKGTGTILVTDDEEIVREFAREILTSHGYEVFLAKDGIEAIHVYQALGHKIDLVIMDMVMPHMNGKKAVSKLRELDPRVKVIFCSGYDFNDPDFDEIRQEGVPFVHKPFHVERLLEQVRSSLSG